MENPEIVIFGRERCSYCDKAKELLTNKEIPFEYHDLSEHPSVLKLLKLIGINTVPVVFRKNQYFGGYGALEVWVNANS